MARHAGASPARPPRMQMRMAEEMAVQKSTWKWAVRMPSVVLPTSSICRMATPKRMPLMPATRVRRILSEMICERIILGVAPMARRMPISVVRSFTVTIMMLETPMAPARRVPMPTSQMRKLTPLNRLSSIWKRTSVLNTIMPFSSVGSMLWALATVSLIRWAMLLITTPGLPVVAMMSTALPRL